MDKNLDTHWSPHVETPTANFPRRFEVALGVLQGRIEAVGESVGPLRTHSDNIK
jgi:hypothetical protein